MRIISGKYKGRHFYPPANVTARPTTDFAKESLFNVLNNHIDFEDITVLDLFAGTGSIGLECISRGARNVIAVEMATTQLNFIRKICGELHIDNLMTVRGDVFKYIASCGLHFDFVFADPPYQLPELSLVPDKVFEHDLLKPDGIFVLEHSDKQQFAEHPHFFEHRRYGSVNFSLFA